MIQVAYNSRNLSISLPLPNAASQRPDTTNSLSELQTISPDIPSILTAEDILLPEHKPQSAARFLSDANWITLIKKNIKGVFLVEYDDMDAYEL